MPAGSNSGKIKVGGKKLRKQRKGRPKEDFDLVESVADFRWRGIAGSFFNPLDVILDQGSIAGHAC